jgi:hypothetical protein
MDKENDVAEKKTLDTTVTEVVGNLRDLLKGSSPTGDYNSETDVLAWADKRGITETVLNKAKRRVFAPRP